MRVALMLPPTADPAEVPDLAARVEEQGFDLIASGEHVLFGSPTSNAFVTLAAAAAVTRRIGLLSAVTLLPLYPPVLTAKMAATLDRLSGGRFELGVGVGGENPAEFAASGVPLRERGKRTDAALDVVRAYLDGQPVDVDGEATRLDPLPVRRPPVWVGGRSEAAMRRAGRAGEVWFPYLCSPDRVARGLRTAHDAAAHHDRDPAEVTGGYLAWTAVGTDHDAARATARAALQRIYGQDMDRILDACVPYGTPDEVAARLGAYRDAGAEQVLFGPACGPGEHAAMVDLFAREVLPAL